MLGAAARRLGDGAGGEITERRSPSSARCSEAGDTVIDGGNTLYRRHPARSRARGARDPYVDVGTSGGVFGLERGFCLMVGGEEEPVARLAPLFASLAPGLDAAQGARPAARATRHRRSSAGSTAGRPARGTS